MNDFQMKIYANFGFWNTRGGRCYKKRDSIYHISNTEESCRKELNITTVGSLGHFERLKWPSSRTFSMALSRGERVDG